MSSGAEPRPQLPPEWEKLEGAAEQVAGAIRAWAERAREDEAEIERLRKCLEELDAERGRTDALAAELERLREKNAAMERRMIQARKKINGLMQKLATLEVEP